MANDRPRWRFRISTLMLLVIIMALALARQGGLDEEGRGGPTGGTDKARLAADL